MINVRHHCLNMALELELGTLPRSTACDTSDVEPVSPRQRRAAVSWGLLLGSAKPRPRVEETGLSVWQKSPQEAEKKLRV